jgi:hypothetical protein
MKFASHVAANDALVRIGAVVQAGSARHLIDLAAIYTRVSQGSGRPTRAGFGGTGNCSNGDFSHFYSVKVTTRRPRVVAHLPLSLCRRSERPDAVRPQIDF